MPRVVVVDGEPERRTRLADALSEDSFDVIGVREADLECTLADAGADVVLVSASSGPHAVELCRRARACAAEAPCIAVTADPSPEPAFEAVRVGVADYRVGEMDLAAVRAAVARVVREARLVALLRRLESSRGPPATLGGWVGESEPTVRVADRIERLAASDATVLLIGATGTGKEVAARALHEASPRHAGPFVALDCASLPEELLESELFGHERGAFTGADRRRRGLLEQADGGTLLLDEITSMALPLQAKLLRALQERTVYRLGGAEEVPFDVRIVAATNVDPAHAVERGAFRADLLYRLDVVRIELPPLCERGWDVLVLAYRFLREEAERTGKPVRGITRGAAERLVAYDWPGNVRELRSCIQHAVVLARWDHITELDLRARIGPRYRERQRAVPSEEEVPLHLVECAHIARVMRDARGNKSLAARILGIDRKTLNRKLVDHGLEALGSEDRSTTRLAAADETRPDTTPFSTR